MTRSVKSSDTDSRLQQYVQEAITLRLNLQQNFDDYHFGIEGGRIVYLMDANVVRIFLDPEREARHFAPFQTSHQAAATTALVSAEFLFSRRLAGQGDTAALIAPSHADDLTSVLAGIKRDADSATPPDRNARESAD